MSALRCIALIALIAACERGPELHGPSATPRLRVARAAVAPTIDGELTDAAWRSASSTGTFVETRTGGSAAVEASAKIAWDERYLYAAIEVNDDLLLASERDHDAHLWRQDCVELMIAPRPDDTGYFEIEVSPRGVVFDTRYDSRRLPEPFGHVGWDSQTVVGAKPRGVIDDDALDRGYSVELAIPWQAFSHDGTDYRRPAPGEEWRANFYVLDLGRHGQRAAAWSPPRVGDFHVPPRFGNLAFEGAETLESPGAPH
jgi:hypothetical protein